MAPNEVHETAMRVDALLADLSDRDRYCIIATLFARLLHSKGVASASTDVDDYTRVFGNSVASILAEMEKSQAAARAS